MNDDTSTTTPETDGIFGIDDDGRAFIRFKRSLDHPIDVVWAAVSEPTHMTNWLAHRIEIDPTVGGAVAIWLGSVDDSVHTYRAVITEFSPPNLLELACDDGSTLRFELSGNADRTTLVFTDTRPIGARTQNSVVAGWHCILDQLPPALAGHQVDWVSRDANRDQDGHVAGIVELYWHYRNQTRLQTELLA